MSAEHTCGVGHCRERARWVLAGEVEGPAATFVCTLHWGILKAHHPEFAYMYCPIGAISTESLAELTVIRTDAEGRRELSTANRDDSLN